MISKKWLMIVVMLSVFGGVCYSFKSKVAEKYVETDYYPFDSTCPLTIKVIPNKFSYRSVPKTDFSLPTILIPDWSKVIAEIRVHPYQLIRAPKFFPKTKNCVILGHPTVPIQFFTTHLSPETTLNGNLPSRTLYKKCQPFRFTIVFASLPHLVISLLAQCIPIYFGSPQSLGPFQTSKRVIAVQSFSSPEQCLEYIRNNHNIHTPACSLEDLKRFVGWFFKHPSFFKPFYHRYPELRCPDFTPQRQIRSDPSCPIKVLNLDRSTDRWEKMLQQFKRKPQLRYERFPALDGNRIPQIYPDLPIRNFKHKVNRFPNFKPGELGVYLSNMELFYLLANDLDNDFYLILEDDVDISALESLDTYIQEAPEDWEILFLGANQHYCKQPQSTHETRYMKMGHDCMPGNFAFMIRRSAAQFYLNFGLPLEVPIDQFQRMSATNLNIYIRIPNVVTTEYLNESTIETDRIVHQNK